MRMVKENKDGLDFNVTYQILPCADILLGENINNMEKTQKLYKMLARKPVMSYRWLINSSKMCRSSSIWERQQ
jgi:hypothetical protein